MFTILSIAAVFRLTYMLQKEAGPFDILYHFRTVINKSKFGASLFGCFWCLSIWVAAPFAWYLSNDLWQWFVYDLALSAGASIIHQVLNRYFP